MIFTGERQLATQLDKNAIEHLHRYAFAKQFTNNKIVVDLACGEGYGTYIISENAKQVTGIDISDETIKHAIKRYKKSNLNYIVGEAIKTIIPSNSIDVVISFETIEHHNKHIEMIMEIKRILKKDGVLIISTPDKNNYSITPKYTNKFHIKELTNIEFFSLIQEHFVYVNKLYQKTSYCSLITTNDNSQFVEFNGNYDSIILNKQMVSPIYNIAIASDNENCTSAFSSSFNGEIVLRNLLNISDISVCNYILAEFYKLGSNVKRLFTKQKINKN